VRSRVVKGLGILVAIGWLTVWFGNDLLILFESDAPSRSEGRRDAGRLVHGKRLPSSGTNFTTYSRLGSLLGRNCVQDRVRDTVLAAYEALATELPQMRFVLGETGWCSGGRLWPHKTHQHGLSVDFMVPVRTVGGEPAVLPTPPWKEFGYDIDFDAEGRYGNLRIDFEALAIHLDLLARSAADNGLAIERVILAPDLQPHLLATRRGARIAGRLPLSTRRAWVRHDEHYHVDFRLNR
jgi:penicillin-insensitive murein endopeptidase